MPILYTPPPDAAAVHKQFIEDKAQVNESKADSLENTVEKAFSPENATELSDSIKYAVTHGNWPFDAEVTAVGVQEMQT